MPYQLRATLHVPYMDILENVYGVWVGYYDMCVATAGDMRYWNFIIFNDY